MNRLFYGDNLHVMKDLMGNAAVDLIYLDPPFKSNQTYNLLYSRRIGRPIPEQEEAFCDTWDMDRKKRELAKAMPVLMRDHGIDEYYVQFWKYWMDALINTQPKLLAYLVYMVQRMMYMKLILKPTGSIFLHCDPEASHYIKVMMDAIFGHDNFQNEIIWKRTSSHSDAKKLGSVHDVIFRYSMSNKSTSNRLFVEYTKDHLNESYRYVDKDGRRHSRSDLTAMGTRRGETGKTWHDINPTDKGRHWIQTPEKLNELDKEGKIYWPDRGTMPRLMKFLDEMEGNPVNDLWTDIPPLGAHDKMRLGFQTQKPPDLLKRIIELSSNEGDVVFDPFCGCGTAVYAAHETGRQWIGCDIAVLAIRLIEDQLDVWYNLKRDTDYTTTGVPNSVESAERLFRQDPFQFEHWIVERVGGFPTKKTGDRGVDGVMYYDLDGGEMGKMIFSVKGGNIRPSDVRDLEGTRSVDDLAHLAGFISLKEPTKAMRQAADDAGKWQYKGDTYNRIQMLTVKEIVEDKRLFRTPTRVQYRDDHLQTALKL